MEDTDLSSALAFMPVLHVDLETELYTPTLEGLRRSAIWRVEAPLTGKSHLNLFTGSLTIS